MSIIVKGKVINLYRDDSLEWHREATVELSPEELAEQAFKQGFHLIKGVDLSQFPQPQQSLDQQISDILKAQPMIGATDQDIIKWKTHEIMKLIFKPIQPHTNVNCYSRVNK